MPLPTPLAASGRNELVRSPRSYRGDAEQAIGIMLLEDAHAAFTEKKVDRFSSKELCDTLNEREDRPWPEFKNGKPLTQRQLARLLEPFGIIPHMLMGGTIWIEELKGGWFIGGSAGRGTLIFHGRRYPLSIGGLSAGLVFGGSVTRLYGYVSNIRSPWDVAGVYGGAGPGAALVVGSRAVCGNPGGRPRTAHNIPKSLRASTRLKPSTCLSKSC